MCNTPGTGAKGCSLKAATNRLQAAGPQAQVSGLTRDSVLHQPAVRHRADWLLLRNLRFRHPWWSAVPSFQERKPLKCKRAENNAFRRARWRETMDGFSIMLSRAEPARDRVFFSRRDDKLCHVRRTLP
jgi:hypothetical protein